MYTTIDIGNPRSLMYAGCNVDSRVQYVSCNEDSHVCKSTLRKIIWKAGSRLNASQVMAIYSGLENFNPKMFFCVPT